MKRVTAILVVALVLVLVVARLTAPFLATPVTVGMFRFLDRRAIDDELPATALTISRVLFWPLGKDAELAAWRAALEDERTPNDLLVFAVTDKVSTRLSVLEARQLFIAQAGALKNTACERKYLVASLIPLAERGKVVTSRTTSLSEAYGTLGQGLGGSRPPNDQCSALDRAIRKLLAAAGEGRIPPTRTTS